MDLLKLTVDHFPRSCNGLLPILKTVFYPHYRFQKIAFNLVAHPERRQCSAQTAKRRGCWLDRDVEALCRVFAGTTEVNSTFVALFQRRHDFWRGHRRHPSIHSLITWLMGRQWRPLVAQLPVWYEPLHLGTYVDLVVLTPDGSLVILELKTGYAQYYWSHTGHFMMAPLDFLEDSPRWQHQLQLWFTFHLAKKTYPGYTWDPSPSGVLRLSQNDEPEFYRLVNWSSPVETGVMQQVQRHQLQEWPI